MSLQVEKDSLYFKGVGGAEKKTYELTMKFLKEVRAKLIYFHELLCWSWWERSLHPVITQWIQNKLGKQYS